MMNRIQAPYRTNLLPQPLFTPQPGQATSFETRLPIVRLVAPLGPKLTPRLAFEALISAACYLSLACTDNPAVTLEAVQMLHDLAREMHEDGLDLGANPNNVEDLIWQSKQRKWEQRNVVEATAGFNKSSNKAQTMDSKSELASEPRPWFARWWSAWHGAARVQPF